VVAVEFALLAVIFFSVMFCMLEVGRAMYLWNTLQEVTRRAARAAAVSAIGDPGLSQSAIFDGADGKLPMGSPVTAANIRIDYLSLGAADLTPSWIPAGLLPGCAARNRINCINNPNGTSCIRFVRARVCAPSADAGSDTCDPLTFTPILPLISLPLPLPVSTTVARAETLGYRPGDALCP